MKKILIILFMLIMACSPSSKKDEPFLAEKITFDADL